MVKSEEPVYSVLYSLDGGNIFSEKMLFPDDVEQLIYVHNIVTEPSSTTNSFIIFGRNESQSFVISLDFSNVLRVCHKKDDLEIFSLDNSCFYGEKVHKLFLLQATFYRRKASSECSIGNPFSPVYANDFCACARVDYSCDESFYPTINGECTLIPGINKSPTLGCNNGVTGISSGFIKRKLSVCKGGDLLDAPLNPSSCELSSSFVSVSILFFPVVLVIISISAWYLMKRNERFGPIRLGSNVFDDSYSSRATRIFGTFGERIVEFIEISIGYAASARHWIEERYRTSRFGREGYLSVVPLSNATNTGIWEDEEDSTTA
jgi:hypothetical protein